MLFKLPEICVRKKVVHVLKEAVYSARRSENACHFSQDHTMVTKFLDFIHNIPSTKKSSQFITNLTVFS